MSKHGQNNQKGVFAQNWAALSLFLQFYKDPKFSYIQLEPNTSEDFDLVFNDGKKIVCETKYRIKKFNYADLKLLLSKILDRKSISEQDEILIVCRSVNETLASDVKNIRFFNRLEEKFLEKNFNKQMIGLIPRVSFWVINKSLHKDINLPLISQAINLWLPQQDLKKFTDHIMQDKIMRLSTQGRAYSRNDFNNEINNLNAYVLQSSDKFNKRLTRKEKQFKMLEDDVNRNKGIKWGTASSSAISAQWDLMSFVLTKLRKRNDLDLKKWDDLWQLKSAFQFIYTVFDIFKNNMGTEQNMTYILGYIQRDIKGIRGFYGHSDFFNHGVVELVTKIIDAPSGHKYLKEAFAIVKYLINFNKDEYFYLKDRDQDRGQWEKEEICKLITKIYKIAPPEIKESVFQLITSGFNLTEDEGEFSHYAPREAFEIIREWLNEDFVNRITPLVNIIVDQYKRFYKKFGKNIEFKGWELMGGGVGIWEGNYRVSDRHFIEYILSPAIRKYYESNKAAGWQLILDKFISKTAQVSSHQPDFLNRAVFDIVCERYAEGDENSNRQAFKILKEFILSPKGIPHKSELIYQNIDRPTMSDEKKWKLVKIMTDKYDIPANPFIEPIVAGLVKKGHPKAKQLLIGWFMNPKFYPRFPFDGRYISTIKGLIETNLDLSIDLFKIIMRSEYIKTAKSEHYDVYDVANILFEILKRDYVQGLSIIRMLESEKALSIDQQIIYTYSLCNYRGNEDSDDLNLLIKVYADIVDPFLTRMHDDINSINHVLTFDNSREALIQFASRLAAKGKIHEALRIVKVFLDDTDPYLPSNAPVGYKIEYNEHQRIERGEAPLTITSVRGWCAWTLMRCSVLSGREYIPMVIEFTKKLIEDNNYYVVHLACNALAHLARNRLTVLPKNSDIMFFNDDKRKALEMAKDVEKIAFSLLDRFVGWPTPVQKALIKDVIYVFDNITQLNESDATKLVTKLIGLPKEAVAESAPLLIFFAETRRDCYAKWNTYYPGLYDDLGPDKYNSDIFKKILTDTIKSLMKDNPKNCFRFASTFEHMLRHDVERKADAEQSTKLGLKYFRLLMEPYSHSIYNIIFQVIQDRMKNPDKYLDEWFLLFIECLNLENRYYDNAVKMGNLEKVFWFPSFYHSDILELIYKGMGQDKFMRAAKIFFNFPKGMQLEESSKLVNIIKELSKSDKEAQRIIKTLIKNNPGKYWDLKEKK